MHLGWDADWFKPLVAVLFGWILSSLSQYLLAFRERRQAISKALSDLLEIRHQLLAVDKAFDELRKIFPLPLEAEAHFRAILEQNILPNPTQLSKRYDESVSLVAAVDPILAFQLRSKDLVRPMLNRLNALVVQDARAAAFGQKLTKTLVPHMEREFNSVIKFLAWRRGPITRWKVGRALESRGFPKEASDVVALIREELEKQQAVGAASGDPAVGRDV